MNWPAVVHFHLEVAVARFEPAVENLEDREAALAERKGARLFFAAMARIAFNPDRHKPFIPKAALDKPRSLRRY